MSGRPTKLDDEFFLKLKAIENKVNIIKKRKQDSKFRTFSKKISLETKNKKCVVCDESRAVEYAHIIPVAYLKRTNKEYQDLANTAENGLFLCKNHHWCFDHMLLTNDELEKIYFTNREFIETVVLEFANSTHKENPNVKSSGVDKKILKDFKNWLEWVSKVFFIKYN